MQTKTEIASQLVDEFPEAATRTLASLAMKRYAGVWTSYDQARNTIRYVRGQTGEKNRRQCSNKKHFKATKGSSDPFGTLPNPKEVLTRWTPAQIDGSAKVLVLSDVHIPYHDATALKLALTDGKSHGANLILLNGDIADFFSVSRWENDPRERNFAAELSDVKEFLRTVRAAFPKARIIYKLGNHEERYIRYMRLKAPEFLGVDNFNLEKVLECAALGVELIENCSPIRIGHLNFLHGHEYRFAISNPVNPARGLFLRAKVHTICGHFHQSSHHSDKTLEEHVISTWSTGCLCNLHPEYRPLNNWNHGFAFAEIGSHGQFQVDNCRIIDGKIYH